MHSEMEALKESRGKSKMLERNDNIVSDLKKNI